MATWVSILLGVGGLVLGCVVAWLVASARHARLEERLRQEREATSEKLQLLLDAEKKMADQFQQLAGEALRASKEDFLQLARTQFDGLHKEASQTLEGKQKAFDELVAPIKESLGKVDEKLQTVEKEREGHYRQLTQHLAHVAEAHRELRAETASLSQALRAPTVRGRWGEIQLRRVVELAGMTDHCDFREQRTFQAEGGALRPDLVVQLPGGASVVVDSKVPLEAYLAAAEATDPKEREARLADHARHVREHVRTLASKTYWKQFEDAPDFVVMFLPGEVFYSAALAEDPALIEEAFQKGVLLASPTTLISILRAIHLGWNQERLAENARKISDEGRALYDRIKVLAEHFERLGKSLKSSVDHYNKAVGSLDQRVVVSARRMKELGAGGGDDPPTLAPVEKLPRALQSPELTSAPSETTDV
jgi:DNA recombination protein RmuC